jgi:CRP-like cAMP-binding protein
MTYANLVLSALAPASLQRLAPNFETVEVGQGHVVHRVDAPVEHVYFLNKGLASLVKTMEDGRSIEVGVVGIEGVLGVSAAFAIGRPLVDSVIQLPGHGVRIRPGVLQEEMARTPTLGVLMARYAQRAVGQFIQIAACNSLHTLRERCCRWLLMAHDSVGSDTFPLTHEILAAILGVQRAGVSVIANTLRQSGLIAYRHGHVTIIDRAGLERQACECYGSLQTLFAQPSEVTGARR